MSYMPLGPAPTKWELVALLNAPKPPPPPIGPPNELMRDGSPLGVALIVALVLGGGYLGWLLAGWVA